MPFHHENLHVYPRMLAFNARVATWTDGWDTKHAIRDQLIRAASSMLENVAMASASHSSMRLRALDYSMGSSLECAACLDLACVKRLLDARTGLAEKLEVSQVARMLVGLRRSWSRLAHGVREDCGDYGAGDEWGDKRLEGADVLFHHETLDVYRLSIEVAKAFCASDAVSRLSRQEFRRLDELLTSMVLNIAEGNGRFSEADQARLLGTSHESAIKLAARLDLFAARNLVSQDEVGVWKAMLERIAAMTFAMITGRRRRGREW